MSSPENWSRSESTEKSNSLVKYAWENSESPGIEVVVKGVSGNYRIYERDNYVRSERQIVSKSFSNKDKARSAAVDWMEDNPIPQ